MLEEWLSRPHVARWFGDAEPDVDELRDPRIAMWIALFGDRPFAFVQDYEVQAFSPHHFDFLAPGSRGIDMYIGESSLIGRGHGSKLLQQHADSLLSSGVPALGIDPHPDNHAAIRAFGKAGFGTVGGPLDTQWGRVILMTRDV